MKQNEKKLEKSSPKKKASSKKAKTSKKSSPKKTVKTTKKSSPKKTSAKTENTSHKKHPAHKTHEKQEVKKSETTENYTKKQKKKDLMTIIVLGILIVLVIVVSFLVPQQTPVDSNISDNNAPVLDNNQTNQTPEESDLTMQDYQQEVLELQKQVISEIKDQQYELMNTLAMDANIDTSDVLACYNENDILAQQQTEAQDLPVILKKIENDIKLGSELGINGTPGIIANGFVNVGYIDYNTLKDQLDSNIEYNFNYDNNSFELDLEKEPEVNIIYSQGTKENTEQLITSIKESEQITQDARDILVDVFENYQTNYIQAKDAKDFIETYNVETVPYVYIDGNSEKIDSFNDKNNLEYVNMLFEKDDGFYNLSSQVVSIIGMQNNISPLIRVLDTEMLTNENDLVLGDENAENKVFVFTDYDCPYCQKFEQEVQTKFIEDYVDTNKSSLVIKDFVVNQSSAIYPAIYSRCLAQENYLDIHEILFNNSEALGQNGLVGDIMTEFEADVNSLEEKYSEVLEEARQQQAQQSQQIQQIQQTQ